MIEDLINSVMGKKKDTTAPPAKEVKHLLVAVDPVGRIIPCGPLFFDSREEAQQSNLKPPEGCYLTTLEVWQ